MQQCEQRIGTKQRKRGQVMKFSMIIPCYNEKENINSLVERVLPIQKKYNVEFILVENGSLDNSKEYFKKNIENHYKNIKVVYVSKNRGYGYGIQQGLWAASGEYVGWMHADMQVAPEICMSFFEYILCHPDQNLMFLKGRRMNRSTFDQFFTKGQAVFNSVLFRKKLYDVGAVPVLFHNSLIDHIDAMPDDFSIELYVYIKAIEKKFVIRRGKVRLSERQNGKSSWNQGWNSKIRQSVRILKDSILIKKGRKVL